MARFGRKEGLNHWLTLESWLGIVIDAVLIKAIYNIEEEEATIVVSMLGKKAVKLVHSVQSQFLCALNYQSVSLSSDLVSQTTRLFVIATRQYYRVVKGEGPTANWLRHYLSEDVIKVRYQAWSKPDLVWAVYSYFFWKEPVRTQDGLQSALIDLLKIAECGRKQREDICTFFGVTDQDALLSVRSSHKLSSSRKIKPTPMAPKLAAEYENVLEEP